ncbi:hypothetical protein [Puniceibacterium sp. IMCC21224]|uniref:hypothetical protein n=1 Tax=Puniceibacterium sp. IMCC21224 TaxID=1618204 RepID=UPI00065D1C5F|nr:hypothetical protein [Puniceibacterium sp. IMCC21224]KMK67141.1 hypothetical protein IMCC21224_112005 [Puniceibacterium sp. IMCC21224]
MSRLALRSVMFALVSIPLCALSVSASTVNETSVSGGDFSGDWQNFSIIESGATTVNGIWNGGGDHDFLAFTSLATGAQTVTLSFSPIGPQGYSYSAGGSVLWKTSPLQYSAWEGTTLGNVNFNHGNQSTSQTLSLALDETFGGALYLQLYNNNGTLQYSISAPGNALGPASGSGDPLVAAVPLPSAALLMFGGLAALLSFGVNRRRSA